MFTKIRSGMFFVMLAGVLVLLTGCLRSSSETTVSTISALYYPSIDTVVGNPTGKITIVEFFDYSCHYCQKISPALDKIISKNPEIRMVYRDYPIFGPVSEYAAQAALAAQNQGGYQALHNALFAAEGKLSEARILSIAGELGLDVNKLKYDMASQQVAKQLQTNASLATDLGIDKAGVPAFIVTATHETVKPNGIQSKLVVGPSVMELQDMIDQVGIDEPSEL